MAYIYINGFESGVFDAAGDQLYTFVSTPPPDSSSTVRSGTGALSMRCTPTGATTRFFRLESAIIGTTQVISGAFYIRRSANTGGTRDIFLVKSVSGVFPKFQVSAAGNFSLHDGTTGGFGLTALTADQWYRVEFLFDYSNNPWNIAWKLDGVDKTGSTPANTASNVEYVAPGISTADSTADYFLDDLVLADTAAEYGVGAVYIKGYIPEAVGSHNLDAATSLHFFKNTGSDIALTTSETDSWQVLDDVPIDGGTDYLLIKPDGVTEPTNTWYAEYQLTGENLIPRAVQAALAVENSAAGTSSLTAKLAEGGSEATVYTGNPGSTTRVYKRGILTAKPSGGAWTSSAFQSLRLRVGYSNDTTPNPRMQAAMVEALFGDESEPEATPGRRFKRFYGPALLPTSATTLFTVDNGCRAKIDHIRLVNNTSSPVDVTMSIGADAAGTRIWDSKTLEADASKSVKGPFTLEAAEIFQAFAGTGSAVTISVYGWQDCL